MVFLRVRLPFVVVLGRIMYFSWYRLDQEDDYSFPVFSCYFRQRYWRWFNQCFCFPSGVAEYLGCGVFPILVERMLWISNIDSLRVINVSMIVGIVSKDLFVTLSIQKFIRRLWCSLPCAGNSKCWILDVYGRVQYLINSSYVSDQTDGWKRHLKIIFCKMDFR